MLPCMFLMQRPDAPALGMCLVVLSAGGPSAKKLKTGVDAVSPLSGDSVVQGSNAGTEVRVGRLFPTATRVDIVQ